MSGSESSTLSGFVVCSISEIRCQSSHEIHFVNSLPSESTMNRSGKFIMSCPSLANVGPKIKSFDGLVNSQSAPSQWWGVVAADCIVRFAPSVDPCNH